ncbi:MAG: hypothetical protein RBS39_01445 [Phycisphaerales bacterium]|jgi:hypothetical protein|nr:hypothetical protein [Phycisphaerales bacterium]
MSRQRLIAYAVAAAVIAVVAVVVLQARRGMDDELVRETGGRLVERLEVEPESREYVRGLFPAAHDVAFQKAYAQASGSGRAASLDWNRYASALLDEMSRAARAAGAGHVADEIDANAAAWRTEGYPVELVPE